MHVPPTHDRLDASDVQLCPQVPQFDGSVDLFTQVPLQSAVGAGHEQAPAVQVIPPLQTVPHAPQLVLSVCLFTQTPLHSVSPVGHVHVPPVHIVPPVHVMPHPP